MLQQIYTPTNGATLAFPTPASVLEAIMHARDQGDIEAVVSCYEADATIVLRPGVVQCGPEALRGWLASFAALKPKFVVTDREIVEGGETALHCSAWKMMGVDRAGREFELEGRSCDVLQRQPDGGWLMAIDNPWGTAILQK